MSFPTPKITWFWDKAHKLQISSNRQKLLFTAYRGIAIFFIIICAFG